MSLLRFSYKELTGSEFTEELDRNSELCDLEAVLVDPKYSQNVATLLSPKRGDVVHLKEAGTYRNDGKAIWNGTKLVPLDSSIDEYGSIPSEFTVGDEFAISHWFGSIRHNTIVWVDTAKHGDELLDNLRPQGTYFTGKLGKFTIKFRTHSFVAAMSAIRKYVKDGAPIHFEAEDSHTLVFEYSIYRELKDSFPGMKLTHSRTRAEFIILSLTGDIEDENNVFIKLYDDYWMTSSLEEYKDYLE